MEGGGGGSGGDGSGSAGTIEDPAGERIEYSIPFIYNENTRTLSKPPGILDVPVRLLHKRPHEFCVKVMLDTHHRNILRIEAGLDNGAVLVEDYTGDLMSLIERLAETETSTDFLQDYLRQIIEGTAELAYSGYYHGNFVEGQTFYTIMENGSYVVKLTDFRSKGETNLSICQREDWYGIGRWIELVVDHFKKQNYLFDTSELEDLGGFLRSALKSNKNPKELKELALDHFYFWSKGRRTAFFTYRVPNWLSESSLFLEKIINNLDCPYPWNDESYYDGYYGLLKAMNDHRDKKSRSPYDGKSKLHYLRFICGCYNHENEIKAQITYTIQTVDAVFRVCDPKLCVKVMKILKICDLVPSM